MWDPFAIDADPYTTRPDDPPTDAKARPGPVDRPTIERLLAEAEAAYVDERWSQALEAYKAVTAFDPLNRKAWLRVGNVHHRRGQLLAAASAYRKAATGPERGERMGPQQRSDANRQAARPRSRQASGGAMDDEARELRTKALVNLASVNIELAAAALDEARALAGSGGASEATTKLQDDVTAEARALAERIDRFTTRGAPRP